MFKAVAFALVLVLMKVTAFVPASTARLQQLAPSARLARVQGAATGIQRSSSRSSALRMAADSEDGKYWQGEWICGDCGWVYDKDDCGGLYFEQQKKGFVCPQCRGPRRRFAKMVGDKVGITQDGGDAAILLFSFLGMAGTVAFGFWFANQ